MSRRPRRTRRARRVLVVACLLAAAVVALGAGGSPAAAPVGAALSGVLAGLGGAAVLRRGLRRREAFRVLLGSAAAVWGVGQLGLAAAIAAGDAAYPTVGDVVSAAAGPLAVAGLAALPRRAREPLANLRLGCEAAVTGSAAAAVLWRLGFSDVIDPTSVAGCAAVVIIVLELCVLALFFIAAVREQDRGLVLAGCGFGAFVAADLATQHAVLHPGGTWPWQAFAAACLAWPVIVLGLARIRARPALLPDRDRPDVERRRSLLAAAVNLGLLGGLLATLMHRPGLDIVVVVLAGLCAVAVAVRELVLNRQNVDLLTRLGELAYRDELTGLANRRALLERLHGHDPWAQGWLLTVDLDNFKDVNGLLGHGTGDALLAGAAHALAGSCGDADEAFRLGGDEFAVLAGGDLARAQRLADRIGAAVRAAALGVPGVGRVALSASVGIAALPTGPVRRDPLRALAESATALQAAKAAGRRRSVVYQGQVAADAERHRLVEDRLREALATGALRVHAQPLVRLADGRISGVEMLARWDDPVLGPVRPDEFVAIAEASSLIVPLGDLVMELSVRAAAEQRFAARDITFGVNVSAVQLRVPGYADGVLALLRRAGIPTCRLVLEVTESSFVSDGDSAVAELGRLASAGVVLAVDDFGAGATSLGYLRRLPAQVLKLDRSLVASVLQDPRSAAIVRSMARLGAESGLDVVAEGIEDEATARACREAGVTFGQGWFYARDLPLDQLDAAVERLGGQPLHRRRLSPAAP